MTGENGAVMARRVKTATETPTIRIVNTATGRRRQLFSPSPARNGSASSARMPMTGPTSSAKVSSSGGISASAAKIQRKKKSGLGTVSIIVGSGAPVGPKGPNQAEHADHGQRDESGEDHVLLERHGHERQTVLVNQLLILLQVGFPLDDPPGHRPLVDAEVDHHQEVDADQADQHAGDDEDVQREEARQRLAGDDRAAEEDLDELQAHDRHAAGDRRADAESPVRVLDPSAGSGR